MNVLAIVTTVLSVISVLFYLIGVIGSSDDPDTIEDVAWVTADVDIGGKKKFEYSFGLTGLSAEGDYVAYDSKKCISDTCDACEDAGATTTAMVIIGLLCAVVTSVVGVLGLMGKEGKMFSIAGIVASILSVIFGIVGFAVFDDCFSEIDDDTDAAEYGPGMALTLIAFLMMLIVCIIYVVQLFKGGAGSVSAA